MTDLITEREMYETCNLWHIEQCKRNKTAIPEGEQRTFLLITFCETEEAIYNARSVIDPAIEEPINEEIFASLTLARQAAVAAAKTLPKHLNGVTKEIMQLNRMAETIKIPLSTLIKVFVESKDEKEFSKKMEELRG